MQPTPIKLKERRCGFCFEDTFSEETSVAISAGNNYVHSCGRAYHVICLDRTPAAPTRTLWTKCACGQPIDAATVPSRPPESWRVKVVRAYDWGNEGAPQTMKTILAVAAAGVICCGVRGVAANAVTDFAGLDTITMGAVAGSGVAVAIATGRAADDNETGNLVVGVVATAVVSAGAIGPVVTDGAAVSGVTGCVACIVGLASFAIVTGAGKLGERIGQLAPVRALCGGAAVARFLISHSIRNFTHHA